MLLEQVVRISEIVLALNFVLQSLEYIRGLQPEKTLGLINLALALLLFNSPVLPVSKSLVRQGQTKGYVW